MYQLQKLYSGLPFEPANTRETGEGAYVAYISREQGAGSMEEEKV